MIITTIITDLSKTLRPGDCMLQFSHELCTGSYECFKAYTKKGCLSFTNENTTAAFSIVCNVQSTGSIDIVAVMSQIL